MVKRMRSFFAVVMLVIAATVNAQVTTSSMSGKVVDQSNEAIIGATIRAINGNIIKIVLYIFELQQYTKQ